MATSAATAAGTFLSPNSTASRASGQRLLAPPSPSLPRIASLAFPLSRSLPRISSPACPRSSLPLAAAAQPRLTSSVKARKEERPAASRVDAESIHEASPRPFPSLSSPRSPSSPSSAPPPSLRSALAAASLALVLLTSPVQSLPALADVEFETYYGTAASASSYGGYGGNASKRATAEYVYDVPVTWKERAISKVEKGTNGTDSEFYNPKKKTEKTYLLFLAGFRRLPPKDNVLNDIALSDVDLQDLLASAESTEFVERNGEGGQLYYDFDIDGTQGHALISITSAKNKLYAHFVNAAPAEWARDESLLRHIHSSFRTVGRDPLAPPDEF